MRLILFGEPEHWEQALHILSTYCLDVEIIGLSGVQIRDFLHEDVVYSLSEIRTLYQNKQVDGIINIESSNIFYFRLLKQCAIFDIYVIPHIIFCRVERGEDLSGEQVLFDYHGILPELHQLEVSLADHCNLNCKGCSHFSNLVPQATFLDKRQFGRDVRRLSELFSQIRTFFLLGGEPLLNPDIADIILMVRETFPYTQITIVTNGLLLPSMKQELIDVIRDNQVKISISDYSCLDREKIVSFVKDHGLEGELRLEKDTFSKYLNVKGNSDKDAMFDQCCRRGCTFLSPGKISACCQPMVIHYFNEHFGEHIPEGEGISLYEEEMNGWKIQEYLATPMESCRFCTTDVPFEWSIANKMDADIKDWCAV